MKLTLRIWSHMHNRHAYSRLQSTILLNALLFCCMYMCYLCAIKSSQCTREHAYSSAWDVDIFSRATTICSLIAVALETTGMDYFIDRQLVDARYQTLWNPLITCIHWPYTVASQYLYFDWMPTSDVDVTWVTSALLATALTVLYIIS